MFQNDVTKNYEFQDATLEILIMLAGAFLLGCLFCWALRKLGGDKKQSSRHQETNHKTRFDTANVSRKKDNSLLQSAKGATVGTAGAIGGSIAATGSSIKGVADDVSDTVSEKVSDTSSAIKNVASDVSGKVGDKISNTGSTITDSIADTASTTGGKLSGIGSNVSDAVSNTAGATKDKLSNAVDSVKETVTETTASTDNFKKIEGIGPKIETVLYAAGINSYADLRASDTTTLRAILDTAGPAFKMHDPETWPYQADLAYNEKWDKLKEYQDFLMGSED